MYKSCLLWYNTPMTAEQQVLKDRVFDIAKRCNLQVDDDVNFNWHDDPELPQELYYAVNFNDAKVDAIVHELNLPVFLSISKHGVRFDIDSSPVIGHHDHAKFNARHVNAAKRYIVENYLAFV